MVAVPILTLDQRIENLQKEHDRLEDKADLRRKYRQPALGALFVGFVLFYATLFLGITLLASSKYLTYTVVTSILATIAFLSIIPLGRRSRTYRFTSMIQSSVRTRSGRSARRPIASTRLSSGWGRLGASSTFGRPQ